MKKPKADAVLGDVLTVKEAAKFGYSVRYIQNLCDCGFIAARKVPETGQWLIYAPSLRAWIMGLRT